MTTPSLLPLLLLLAAAPGPEAGPRPTGDAGSWVTLGDYPQEALAKHEAGAVEFRLEVDVTGRVTGCTIVRSSGSASLDGATCRLLATRARFTPAQDASGKAVAGTFASRITWIYPQVVEVAAAPIPAPVELGGGVRTGDGASVLKVDEQGIITACEPAPKPYDNAAVPADICRLFPVGARYGAPGLTHGKPVKRKVTVYLTVMDVNVR